MSYKHKTDIEHILREYDFLSDEKFEPIFREFVEVYRKAEAFDAGIEHIDRSLGYLAEDLEVEEDSYIRSYLLNEIAALKLAKQIMTERTD